MDANGLWGCYVDALLEGGGGVACERGVIVFVWGLAGMKGVQEDSAKTHASWFRRADERKVTK